MRRNPAGQGYIERGHFFDSAASMWVAGELVHVEDLVLHDAHMDVRTPTHELTISHAILRARRRIAKAAPGWAVSDAGIAALIGRPADDVEVPERLVRVSMQDDGDQVDQAWDADGPLAEAFAHVDAVLVRSQHLIDGAVDVSERVAPAATSLSVGDLMIRDPDWDEQDRLTQWKQIVKQAEGLPPTLGAAIIWDAWESLEPMQRQHWLGTLLVGAHLRSRRKIASHLLCFNVGLRAIPRERRRSHSRTTRLLAFLDAMSAAADAGAKELDRLQQARDMMLRRLRDRRSSSRLPGVIDLVLSRPIVSAAMIAKLMRVTPRSALNLISELGVREMTGRGRYRGWGIL